MDGHGRRLVQRDTDAAGYSGTRTNMDERIAQQIGQLEREKAEFMLLAPVRAEERMQALRAQLQMEISMRMEHYDAQINSLKELLAEPAKESD